MARAGRLAGAILAETEQRYFLVGSTKEPCDFASAALRTPVTTPARAPWFVPLERLDTNPVRLEPPVLELDVEGEAVAHLLAARFVIDRNGSVSERLWRLVLSGGDPEHDDEPPPLVDARWLGELPAPFWKLVRDTVLRCL